MSEILLNSKLRELEEDLKNERDHRHKFEKELTSVRLDYSDMENQLQEAILAKEREVEAGKRLRQEIADLKQKIDNQQHVSEESAALVRRKHAETIAELTTHMETVNKTKLKFEKDYKQFLHQNEELRKENDQLLKGKSTISLACKDFENKYNEANRRLDEVVRQLNEANDSKNKLTHQNNESSKRNLALEHEVQQLSMNNKKINQELDDAKLALETETMCKTTLETKNRNLQTDLESTSAQLEEETEYKLELQKQLSKLQEEFRMNKERLEKECGGKVDEYEDYKRKMNTRITDLQDQLLDAQSKFSNSEKARQKLQNQINSLTSDCDTYKKRVDESIKIEKTLNKEVEDMRARFTQISTELETSYQTARQFSNDLSKQKHVNEQLAEQIESMIKEKRRHSDEVENLSNQLMDAQSKIIDLERKIKSVESERQKVENDLDDMKDAHQSEASRSHTLQIQFDKLKSEHERRLQEKEDEIDSQKTALKRALEQTNTQLEDIENRHKADLANLRKKTAGELEELKTKVEDARKSKLDAEASLKKLQQTNKELTDKITEEEHLHDETTTQLTVAEKKIATLKVELDETKALLDRSEKTKKSYDSDYQDLEERLSEALNAMNKAIAERKKLETDAVQASDELQEHKYEIKMLEEKVRQITIINKKREEELKNEKEYSAELESGRKSMEAQVRDAQAKLEEMEEHTKRESKKISISLESRLIELESELDAEKAKEVEFVNIIRRMEKRNKELVERLNEDQAKLIHFSDAYNKLFEKAKKYKALIAGAEEQVQATESKCKRLQRELEDADERAESVAKSFIDRSRAGSVMSSRIMDTYDSDYGDSDQISLNQFPGSVINMPTAYSRSFMKNGEEFSGGPPSALERSSSVMDRSSRGPSVNSWRTNKPFKPLDLDDDDLAIPPSRASSKYSGAPSYNHPPKSASRAASVSRTDRSRSVTSFYDFEANLPHQLSGNAKQRDPLGAGDPRQPLESQQYYRYSSNSNSNSASSRNSLASTALNSALASGRTSTRNSVSRLEDEDLMMDSTSLVESFRSKYNRTSTSKLLEKYAAEKNEMNVSKYESKLNDLEQRLSSVSKKKESKEKETSVIEKKMILGSEHSDGGVDLENLETPESRTPENMD